VSDTVQLPMKNATRHDSSVRRVAKDTWAVYFGIACGITMLLGLLLGEARSSPIHGDFLFYHLRAIELFRSEPWAIAVQDYPSATMPLYHMLASLDPFLPDTNVLRFANFCLSIATWLLFVKALQLRFREGVRSDQWWWFCGGLLIASPYFRSQAFWPATDNVALMFAILSLFFLYVVESMATEELMDRRGLIKHDVLVILSILAGVCAFYTRQTYIFAIGYISLSMLLNLKRGRLWLLLVPILLLPALYLVKIWHGLTPPSFQLRHQGGLGIQDIVFPSAMIALCSVPLLVEWFLQHRRGTINILKSHNLKKIALFVVAGIIFCVMLEPFARQVYWANNGPYFEVIYALGRPATFVYVALSYVGFLLLVWLKRKSSWESYAFFLLFFFPLAMLKVNFQRYYDPIVLVFFFLVGDRKAVLPFTTRRCAFLIMLAELATLVGQSIHRS
jgi:hypothetical protein